MPSFPRFRPRLRATACLFVALCVASPALAQFGGGMFGGDLERTLNSKQLERIVELLKLDETQAMVAEDFLSVYISDHSAIVEEREMLTQATREEFRETRDPSVWREMGSKMRSLSEEAEGVEQQFFEDVKLLLNESQFERWPIVQREHRRTSTIDRGLLSGESVDLVEIVRTVAPEYESPELAQIIESYAGELDRVLIKRNEVYTSGLSQARDLMRSGDFETINELFDEAREAGLRVRNINRRYARQIEPLLPEDIRGKFDREVQEGSFPRVYRRSYAGRVFASVEEIGDLSAEQSERIEAIRATYSRQAQTINTKWAKAIEENELSMDVMSMMRRGRGNNTPDDISEARSARRELDQKVAGQIKDVLTDKQAAKLPEEPRFDRDRRRGQDGRRGRRGRTDA